MEKSLLALAALGAFAGAAHAQSSVTLYGIIDAGIAYTNNTGGQHNFFTSKGRAAARACAARKTWAAV